MSKVIHSENIATITPTEVIESFPVLYASALKRGNIGLQPARMIWGSPGIGKSETVQQMAERTGSITGRKSNVTIASLLLMSPVDLRGIPTKAETTVMENGHEVHELVARWLKPQIFQMDPSDDVINWLFLDEISAAPPAVQAAAYQIVLNRRVGEHEFPKNCVVIGAGNRVTDRAVAYKMPKPLANRFTHYEMTVDVEGWCAWALQHNIHQYIIGYVRFNPDRLFDFNATSDDVAFPTPRSWALVNEHLIDGAEYAKSRNLNLVDAMYPHIAGTVSARIATDFKTYVDVYASLPTWADIVSGKEDHCRIGAKDLGTLYALSSMIASNMYNEQEKLANASQNQADAFLTIVGKYIHTIPRKDIVVLIARDILRSCNKIHGIVVRNSEFSAVIRDIADLIIDIPGR